MKVKTVIVPTGYDRLPEITAKVNLEFSKVYIRYTDIKVFSMNEEPEKPRVQIKKDGHATSAIVSSKIIPGASCGVIPEVKIL
jgi:hypothetical protein